GTRVIRGTVLRGPERAAGEILVAQHIEYAVTDVGGAEELGMLGDRSSREQAPVGVTLDPEVRGARIALRDQVFRGPGKIVEYVLLVREHAGLVPFLAVGIAAAHVGHGIYPAELEPYGQHRIEGRHDRDIEATITVE